MTAKTLDAQIERHLNQEAIRYTSGRRMVVHTLAAADGPRSAAELHTSVGNAVPLSSLYRTLAVLEGAGVIVPHHAMKGITRFELAEWLTGHHHHLVCIDCGVVEDIDIPDQIEAELQALVEDIGTAATFTPSNHALEIEGRCARCA